MYDGTSDPYDHTYSYKRLMRFYGHTAAGKCHLFISTLKKIAREWMITLPPRSISSWEELNERFHTRFGNNMKREKMTTSLIQIRQKSNKYLWQYIKRFCEALVEIPTLDRSRQYTSSRWVWTLTNPVAWSRKLSPKPLKMPIIKLKTI